MEPYYDEEDYLDPEEKPCLVCGGEGYMENHDPMWHGFDVDEIVCTSCRGSGLAKDMTWC